jgi:hypothetical protein
MVRLGSSRILRAAGKIICKYLPIPAGLSIVKRHKCYKKSFLRFRRPVPTAMKGDKSAVLVFVRELIPGLE